MPFLTYIATPKEVVKQFSVIAFTLIVAGHFATVTSLLLNIKRWAIFAIGASSVIASGIGLFLQIKALDGNAGIYKWLIGYTFVGFVLRSIKSLQDSYRPILAMLSTPSNYVYPFVFIFSFARSVYPEIDPEWGGGKLIPITLKLGSTAVAPNQEFKRLLIEESADGIYVIDHSGAKAHFIPKKDISLIVYE